MEQNNLYNMSLGPNSQEWWYQWYGSYYGNPPDPFAGIQAYYAANIMGQPTPKNLVGQNDPTSYGGTAGMSYLGNMEVLNGQLRVDTISDGSSNTILFAEGYASCWGVSSSPYTYRDMTISSAPDTYPWTQFYDQNYGYNYVGPGFGLDRGYSVYNNQTGSYTYKPPSDTFQERPQPSACNSRMPQSLASGAIQVGLGDGSVRGIASGVSFGSWGAALTPAGGEVIGSDF